MSHVESGMSGKEVQEGWVDDWKQEGGNPDSTVSWVCFMNSG